MVSKQKIALLSSALFLITFSLIFGGIKSTLKSTGSAITKTGQTTIGNIKEGGETAVNKIGSTGQKVVDTTVQVGNATVDVVDVIKALANKIPRLVGTINDSIASAKIIEANQLASQKIRNVPLIINKIQIMLTDQFEPIIHSLVPLMKDVDKPDIAQQIDGACKMIKTLSDSLDLLNATLAVTADTVAEFGK